MPPRQDVERRCLRGEAGADLLSTFLSPAWNRRDDAYGNSLEGRTRLLTEVITEVRDRCGPDFAVIVRLDGHEYGVEGGITIGDAADHARAAVAAGADAVHVSATSSAGTGVGFTDAPLPWQPNQYEGLARAVKAAVDVPVLAVGRIRPMDAERILGDGGADFVSMGRQLLADPDLVRRLGDGRPDLVRPCINCFVWIRIINTASDDLCDMKISFRYLTFLKATFDSTSSIY